MHRERITYIRNIFAKSFLLTRQWEVIFNRSASPDDITLKQLMLLIVARNAFQHPPTIKELSEKLVTSHQNVKAIATQLEKKGFVAIKTDDTDKRVSRILVTEDKSGYWEERQQKDTAEMMVLFEGVELDELMVTSSTIEKLLGNLVKK